MHQINTTAWIQGQYMVAAISACISKDFTYPRQPLNIFKYQDEPAISEKRTSKHSAVEDSIRAQSAKIDAILKSRK